MRKLRKTLVATVALFLVFPWGVFALSGSGVDKTKIKVDSKAGGEWFRSLVDRTDDDGVLKVKNVLPGWYRFKLRSEDQSGTQTLAVKLRMLDNDGRRLKEDTTFSLYAEISGVEVAVGTVESDEDGWVEVSGLSFEVPYKLALDDDDNSHVSKKENTARVKVKTKINGDWFKSGYSRTEKDGSYVLECKDVLPGKYKFKYKSGDRDPALPFTLKARLLDEKGKDIDEPSKVEVYAYLQVEGKKTRTLVGTVMTDNEGWVMLPGVMTGMTYKIKVKD